MDEARSSPAWLAGVNEWLLAHRSYPEMARRLGQEGAVGVRFTVDRDGRVLNVSLVRSSGSEVLDQAAQEMLRNARLPAFPSDILQAQQTVTISIHYRLD
jgi:periplasmic protein TonB